MAYDNEPNRCRRTLVVGAGPLGLLVATMLSDRGYPVTLLGRDPVIVDQVNAVGARVLGDSARSSAAMAATDRLSAQAGSFDLMVLAVGPDHARAALRGALAWLDEQAVVVGLGAGLLDAELARVVGPHRYLGAVATFAASEVAPGVVARSGLGGFVVGPVDDADAPGWLREPDEAEAEPDEPGDEADGEAAAGGPADEADTQGVAVADAPQPHAPPNVETPLEAAPTATAPEAAPAEERLTSEGDAAPTEPSAETERAPGDLAAASAPADSHPDVRSIRGDAGHAGAWVLRALEAVAPVTVTSNLLGARWAELAVRCAFEPLAATAGLGADALADHGFARELFLALLAEVSGLARARRVILAELPGLPLAGLLGRHAFDSSAPTGADESPLAGPPVGWSSHARHELVHNLAGRYDMARGALGERIGAGRFVSTSSLRRMTIDLAPADGPPCRLLEAALELVDRIAQRKERASLAALEKLYRRGLAPAE